MSEEWLYSAEIKDHFFNPRNFVTEEKPDFSYNGFAQVGSIENGDLIKFWIKVNSKTNRIEKCGWQTFGCASAIAATSMTSLMLTENGGMPLDKIKRITPESIEKRLNGLPPEKKSCAIRGDQAVTMAIKNYLQSQSKPE